MILEQTKKKVEEFLKTFDFLFGVQYYEKSITYSDQKQNVFADIIVDREYQRINITIYPKFFQQSLQEQRQTLIHELCHTITEDLSDIGESLLAGRLKTKEDLRVANEEATSKIANLLDRFLQDKFDFAKKAYKNYANIRQNKVNKRRNRSRIRKTASTKGRQSSK